MSWSVVGNVGVITLDRPEKLNALNLEVLQQLSGAVNRAWGEKSVRAVVLTGNGRAFSAGADMAYSSDHHVDRSTPDWTSELHSVMSRLYWLPKPVVAAVNGLAYGAGCDLTLAADVRFASSVARFSEAYTGIAYSPDGGGSYLLPRIVGEAWAADMVFTGRVVEADEALRLGLVSRVLDPDALLCAAMEQATTYAAGPTVALGLAKRNMRSAYGLAFEAALQNERAAGDICRQTWDHVEGVTALSERRPARFEGR
ncbi:enoyl-CoA hydratase/isomerase family protein [Aeromicrobium sp. zg-636]|uniref:Enoyl-CoA hydratase/isomerase family protein n=1 Tax=Aeromicrobium senzhongii TaxID=2663859 RepID=A0A8I0ERZ7_9ACTN|nr:enoyl-CoA hydratase-related protein [Aeromicrobium sp. 636]MBC9225120.1 enoyl-CoA hydratase/isomerase family protein [Aeromicrobium senzhongii]